VPTIDEDDILDLDLANYPGGVGCWGATKPIVTYGKVQPDAGVHVHARKQPSGPKDIDHTYVMVRVVNGDQTITLDEASCLAFLLSSIAGQPMVELTCHWCGWTHLDRDIFAVEPHRKHLCNRCGRNFWHNTPTISNPAATVRRLGVAAPLAPQPAMADLALRTRDFSTFALWASNPAILWTCAEPEQEGIHVHAWDQAGILIRDETYRRVNIDGADIDVGQLRLLMAQQVVLGDSRRIVGLTCPQCGAVHADRGLAAFKPTSNKPCSTCGTTFPTPGHRRLVSNPIITTIDGLQLG